MDERRNLARGASEWADTYGSLGAAAPVRLMQLPLHILEPWQDTDGGLQPFKPYTPAMLEDLAENIRKNGIIQPVTVRPRSGSRFQIIAGHNRVAAAKIAGLTTVPALVQELDDDQAAILMVDSNLKTRPHILPSERARAYRIRMEKLSHQGKRTDLTSGPMVHKLTDDESASTYGPMVHKSTSRDTIAQETGINARQIQRYLRLNDLHARFLQMVDNGSLDKEQQDKNIPVMALRAGVELSYIPMELQELLLQVMAEYECKAPSMSQASQLRALAAAQELDEEAICGVMVKNPSPKADVLKLPAGRISRFFPPNTSPEAMEAEICKALEAYRNNNTPASD